jgi:hypothetical protein
VIAKDDIRPGQRKQRLPGPRQNSQILAVRESYVVEQIGISPHRLDRIGNPPGKVRRRQILDVGRSKRMVRAFQFA